MDDIAAAGAIISRVKEIERAAEMDDLSRTALWLYEESGHDIDALIRESRPYRMLIRLNAKRDIDYCLREDSTDTVPVCEGEEII